MKRLVVVISIFVAAIAIAPVLSQSFMGGDRLARDGVD